MPMRISTSWAGILKPRGPNRGKDRTHDATVPSLTVKSSLLHTERLVPDGISRALARVGARMNAWVALDAALGGVAMGAAIVAGARIERMPLRPALAAAVAVALVVAVREAKGRWV